MLISTNANVENSSSKYLLVAHILRATMSIHSLFGIARWIAYEHQDNYCTEKKENENKQARIHHHVEEPSKPPTT